MTHLIACDTASIDLLDLQTGEFGHQWAVADLESTVPKFLEPFLAMLEQHPFRGPLQRGHLLTPQRFSDVVRLADLEKLELYNEVFAPLGVKRQMSVGLPSNPVYIVALNREKSDFTEHDKLLFAAIAPHLAAAVETSLAVKEVTGRCETLEGAMNRSAEPLILLGSRADVVHATSAALTLIEQHLSPDAITVNRLPDEVHAWVSGQLRRHSREDDLVSHTSLTVKAARGSLEFILVRSNGAHTLLLRPCEKADEPTPLGSDQPALLTPREIQVLEWVNQGMANADIAVLCGISVRTVHKHLEHAFRKLNVENRAAAARRWRDIRSTSGEVAATMPLPKTVAHTVRG